MEEQQETAVNRESVTQQNHLHPSPPAMPEVSKPKNSTPEQPATARQLHAVEQQMSAFERSTLRWARAAVIVSGLAFAVVCAQWWEMHTGGVDTHNLAVAAGNQATWTQNLANNMQIQAERTKDLANRMKEQADQTRVIAGQAVIQANAAESAARTAKEALHVSERAYLVLGSPIDDFPHRRINIPIVNSGHVPSGTVKVIVHEATMRVDDPAERIIPNSAVIESHWRENTYESIPVVPAGNLINVEVNFPALVQSDLSSGKQGIVVVAVMTYNDGFRHTPEQTWSFCDISSYANDTKLFLMRPCYANTELPSLLALDHYPDPNYQEK